MRDFLPHSLTLAYARACDFTSLPSWAILGEYDNGSASGAGRVEYIWLPTDDGNAIPIAMFRGARYCSRAITNQPVLLNTTTPMKFNLRFPGQFYSYYRNDLLGQCHIQRDSCFPACPGP